MVLVKILLRERSQHKLLLAIKDMQAVELFSRCNQQEQMGARYQMDKMEL
jgi:hypothetical protein